MAPLPSTHFAVFGISSVEHKGIIVLMLFAVMGKTPTHPFLVTRAAAWVAL